MSSANGKVETKKRLLCTLSAPNPLPRTERMSIENYPPVNLMKLVSGSENGYNFLMALTRLVATEAAVFGSNVRVKRVFSDCSELILNTVLSVYDRETKEEYLTRMLQLLYTETAFPSNMTLVNWCFPHAMAAVSRHAQYELHPLDKKVPLSKAARTVFKRYLQRTQEFTTMLKSYPYLVMWTKVSLLAQRCMRPPFHLMGRRPTNGSNLRVERNICN